MLVFLTGTEPRRNGPAPLHFARSGPSIEMGCPAKSGLSLRWLGPCQEKSKSVKWASHGLRSPRRVSIFSFFALATLRQPMPRDRITHVSISSFSVLLSQFQNTSFFTSSLITRFILKISTSLIICLILKIYTNTITFKLFFENIK